jgi:phage gp29-like protein
MPKRQTKTHIAPKRVEMAIRNRFNPLRNFSYEKLVRQLEAFHAGYLSDAARIWDAMERRDIYLGNVASKRKKAAARLSWEILQTEESAEADRQAEILRGFYNSIRATSVLEQNERGGLSLLVRQMMDAVGKRFAVHEIVWTLGPDGPRAEFLFCPLWWFENRTGKLRFLTHDGELEGEEMLDGEWMVTVGEGIMESCSVVKALKDLPLKDWAAFSEKFGMPGVLGKTAAAVDSKEWKAMEDAVRNYMNDWIAVCSQTDEIQLVEVKGGGSNLPFPPLVEYCDRALAARWRGADLSTISSGKQSEGSGASLQGDETDLILEDDAALVSEALNQQVDKFVLQYAFGRDVEPKAYIKIVPPNNSDTSKQISIDNFFITNGIPLAVNDIYERYGREIPEDGDEVVGSEPVEPAANERLENSALQKADRFIAKSKKTFAEGTRQAFKPVAVELQRIFAIQNEALQRVELRQFLLRLKGNQFSASITNEDQLNALKDAISTAFLNGKAASQKETKI